MELRRIFLFGNPRFERNEQPVVIPRRKAVALMAYLAVTGTSHNRDELTALFWPENDKSTARANLRRNLSRLRTFLGDDVIHTYADNVECASQAGVWVDVLAFRAKAALLGPSRSLSMVGPEEAATLAEAAALYTDDFLKAFSLSDSPGFDEWAFFEAEGLRQDFAAVLQQLIQWHSESGEYASAIDYSRRWVALDTLNEAAQRQLMLQYALSGQQAAALRQYEQCARLLETELGIAPAAETLALYQRIHAREFGAHNADVSITSPIMLPVEPSQSKLTGPMFKLPVDPIPFVGRDREMQDICELLAGESPHRVVTITGPSGIGKSRLASAVAAASASGFADGVCFVPLGLATTADRVVPVMAEALDFRFSGEIAPREQLFGFLKDKHLLLVLDNLESVPDSVCFVSDLLHAASQLKVIGTSQERLNYSGEVVYALRGLSFPLPGAENGVFDCDSVKLFVQSGRMVRPDLELTADQIADVVRICHLVRGVPLAIILAAGWLEVLSVSQIADEIAQSLDFLAAEVHDVPERQSSVRAAFNYSWKRLLPEHQRALMRLSAFRGKFTREAAQAVAGTNLQLLRVLINKSFVTVDAQGDYEIHELLRQYAEEELELDGAADATRDAHSHYYLTWVSGLEADLKGQRQLLALAEIEEALQDVLAAWQWALEHRHLSMIRAAIECIYLFYEMRSRFHEGSELFGAAQRHVGGLPGEEAKCLQQLLVVRMVMLRSRFMNDTTDLSDVLTATLDSAQQCAGATEEAFALLTLGYHAADRLHDFQRGADYFKRSLAIYQSLADQFYISRAYHRIGYCALPLSGMPAFMAYTSQGLEIARQAGDVFDAAVCLAGMASVGMLCREHIERIGDYCHEAIALSQGSGDRLPLAQAEAILGFMYALQGDLVTARLHCAEGGALARSVNFPITIAFSLVGQSLIASLECDGLKALQLAESSKALPSNAAVHMLADWATALARCTMSDCATAWNSLLAATDFALAAGATGAHGLLLAVAAPLIAERGDLERALQMLALASTFPPNFTGWMRTWLVLTGLKSSLMKALGEKAYTMAWRYGRELDSERTLAELRG